MCDQSHGQDRLAAGPEIAHHANGLDRFRRGGLAAVQFQPQLLAGAWRQLQPGELAHLPRRRGLDLELARHTVGAEVIDEQRHRLRFGRVQAVGGLAEDDFLLRPETDFWYCTRCS